MSFKHDVWRKAIEEAEGKVLELINTEDQPSSLQRITGTYNRPLEPVEDFANRIVNEIKIRLDNLKQAREELKLLGSDKIKKTE